jgi:hypothetical protein
MDRKALWLLLLAGLTAVAAAAPGGSDSRAPGGGRARSRLQAGRENRAWRPQRASGRLEGARGSLLQLRTG